MRFCAFREYGAVATGVTLEGDRVVSLDDINDALGTDLGPDLDAFLARGQESAFRRALADGKRMPPTSGWKRANLSYAAPLARPGKIWGIGLNFAAHASDLNADPGAAPAAWMRPASTLAGDGASISLPLGVGRVTAEAEIAVIMGRRARNLGSRKEARDAVFGFTPALDLTAEELLLKNARYLTQAKSYDGFCVLGPFVVTADEWEPSPTTRIVTTVDDISKAGAVAQMRHDPYELIRHFSHVFAWEPGDILLTGTPGALPLKSGSTMRAEIDGLPTLSARVA